MNKQDIIIYNNAKKETESQINIMIQHSPDEETMTKLLEIERMLLLLE